MGNYRFSDTNGAFQIRNNCLYNNANWSYQISRMLAGQITSNVRNYETVTYGDQLSFRVLIGGRAGSAVLTIGGTVRMVP